MSSRLFLFLLIFIAPFLWARAVDVTRVAFGSCARQNDPQPVWDAVLDAKPDLFIFLGDNIYADTTNAAVMKNAYAQLAAVPGFQKLKAHCRIMATWDDHDYGKNDAGAEFSFKKTSQQLFLDFWGVPAGSPRRRQQGVYTADIVGEPGRRVQVILLDTRYFRSKKTMLGAAQWAWLERELRKPAEIRLLGSSIQVLATEQEFEKWGDLPKERARLMNLFRTIKGRVIVLSGDRHFAELSVDKDSLAYPLYDLTSSSLNNTMKRRTIDEPNHRRVTMFNADDNFGFVEVSWEQPDPIVTLQIRDTAGRAVIEKHFSK